MSYPQLRLKYLAMKYFLTLVLALVLTACAPTSPRTLTLITADGEVRQIETDAETIAAALAAADVDYTAQDALLLDGHPAAADAPLDCTRCTLQIRPSVSLALVHDGQERSLQTTVFTLGAALTENGLKPAFGDNLSLPAQTPLSAPLRVVWAAGQPVRVESSAGVWRFPASAETVAAALASAGIPLQGLDITRPQPSAALPADGVIRLTHITEDIVLDTEIIPFETVRQPDNTLEVDQQTVLQSGEYGLALQRTRIYLEDGQETRRVTEDRRIIRPPRQQIVAYGTRIALHTLDTPYGQLQYWRAIQMYATSYSPCRSSADRCYYKTSSGVPVQHGVVAMLRDWYLTLRGMQVYIPGYGIASIEDVGAGFPDGRPWIDLGYSDDDYQIWSGWVTVYFLAPAPAEIPWMLR